MRHRLGAVAVLLALSALMPRTASAQQQQQQQQSPPPSSPPPAATPVLQQQKSDSAAKSNRERSQGFKLGQNYPNPFNPETKIPFTLGDEPCTDAGRKYRVTLRIYNLLAQQVAIPVLLNAGGNNVDGSRVELRNVELTCGKYIAWWDGKYAGTGREVASGVYLYRMEVDGKADVKKAIVLK